MLYGSSPFPDMTADELGLQPVMTLESELIAVRHIAPGERVGYGGTFTAERPMTHRRRRLRLCRRLSAPCAERHAGAGRRTALAHCVGRVSMDKLCVDLTEQKVSAGDTGSVWRRRWRLCGAKGLPADEVAAAAGTISYELFCALAPRVPVTEVELMAKAKSIYTCTECGAPSPKWQGQCPGCGQWNTLVESVAETGGGGNRFGTSFVRALAATGKLQDLAEIKPREEPRQPTGIEEFDRVLGGGLVAGGVVLIGGDPGIGKSTLLLQALARLAEAGTTVLYVSGEESPRAGGAAGAAAGAAGGGDCAAARNQSGKDHRHARRKTSRRSR